ncbi:MAG: CBS domain-containing protein [Candidatus Thermoplasmatota archaeon]
MTTLESLLRRDFKLVDKRDELHTVLGWVKGDSDKLPLVMDGDKPYGVISERTLMTRRLDPNSHIENYTVTTRALPLDSTIEQAAARMRDMRAAHLPIEDKSGKLVGYISALDVARAQARTGQASDLALPVTMLQEKHTLGDALHHFTQEYVDYLPVTNGGGQVTGVLPRRTVLRMELNAGHSRGRKDNVGEKPRILNDAIDGFMDDSFVVVPAAASFASVLDAIEENGYAIVQDKGGRTLGVVTPETLLNSTKPL